MPIRRQVIEAVRALVYLLPPALVLVVASPMLLSPFINEEPVGLDYVFVAVPLYLGIIAVPGYLYAFSAGHRAQNMRPRARWWVRVSLMSGLVASVWATVTVGPAWREILPLALLPVSSTVTSALLLFRFEFRDGGLGKQAVMVQTAKEH